MVCIKHLSITLQFTLHEAKIKNKFVSPYPTGCQNRPTEFIGNLPSLIWVFFRFVENSVFQIRFAKRSIFSHSRAHLCRQKKKKPTYIYLPTSKIVGRVRGNRNIFNCGLIHLCLPGLEKWQGKMPWGEDQVIIMSYCFI